MFTPDSSIDFNAIFAIITAIGVIYSIYKSSKSTSKEDAKKNSDEIKENLTGILKANLKLDNLCNSTDEIRMDIKGLSSRMDKLSETQVRHDTIISEMKTDIERINNRVDKIEEELIK